MGPQVLCRSLQVCWCVASALMKLLLFSTHTAIHHLLTSADPSARRCHRRPRTSAPSAPRRPRRWTRRARRRRRLRRRRHRPWRRPMRPSRSRRRTEGVWYPMRSAGSDCVSSNSLPFLIVIIYCIAYVVKKHGHQAARIAPGVVWPLACNSLLSKDV